MHFLYQIHHLLYQLYAHYYLVQTLNELQHVLVHVHNLQGEHNASSEKPNATVKRLFVFSLKMVHMY